MAQEQIPATFLEEFRKLQREVAELRKAARLNSASVSGILRIIGKLFVQGRIEVATGEDGSRGDLVIRDGGRLRVAHPDSAGGGDAVYAGDLYSEDDGDVYAGTGLLVQAVDGQDILSARTDAESGGVKVLVRGSNATMAVSTDAVRGGLNYPIIPFAFHPYRPLSWESTTSGTFEPVLRAFPRKSGPKAIVTVSGTCDGGTAGEARVALNGTQVGPTITIPSAGATSAVIFDLPDPLDWDNVTVTVDARRTAGAGNVYVNVNSASSWPAG